ncbi:SOS response-associated peptidase [Alpinimonas psychrophila]|uniref:Abasic site processing protein n=1 Tax=Alpinimonas psychrophila TaxID=748908 RepID=A0A7W3PNH9_9MICO|nr:SOS response-associated peptidase [Alpinimonas psychrophila]MBA8828228.1 putative SOS response-associated peptidase YedK [Alpinimonas psychrophila]
MPELFAGIAEWSNVPENFNGAPSVQVSHIRDAPDLPNQEAHHVLDAAHWGFVAAWKESISERPQPFNARIESVSTNGMFREAFRRRRGIIPALGYYEWRVMGDGTKVPYFISAPTAIITRDALGHSAEIHDRMPVMLMPSAYDAWLGDTLSSAASAVSLLSDSSAVIAETIELRPVNKRVGNVRNNDPDLINPVEA